MVDKPRPYQDVYKCDGSFVRVFDSEFDSEELVWHRDKHDRDITVIEGTGWQIQFDDEMPVDINTIKSIPKMVYHRVLKGEGRLVMEIREQ